jgi:addiction module HigA family antidote
MIGLPTDRAPTHPGEMLREEFLPDFGWTQRELADRLRISFRRVNEILNEKRPVTMDTALRLGRLFGTSPELWLGLQMDYDLWHALHGDLGEEIAREVQPLKVG